LSSEELDELLNDAFEHLWQGRYRMALASAKKVFDQKQDDAQSAVCLAWAYLENGNTAQALELANYAVDLSADEVEPHLYRGFILMRLGIFEGALLDLNIAIKHKVKLLAWAYVNKARALAGCGRYFEALEEIERAREIGGNKDEKLLKLRKWYRRAAGIKKGLFGDSFKSEMELLEDGEEAMKQQEFWFAIWAAKKILEDPSKINQYDEANLLRLEALIALFQFKPAYEEAKLLEERLGPYERYQAAMYKILQNYTPSPKDESIASDTNIEARRTDVQRFNEDFITTINCRVFDPNRNPALNAGAYYLQFNKEAVTLIAAETIVFNPYYLKENIKWPCEAIWFNNEAEIGKRDFELEIEKDWKDVVFVQTFGSEIKGQWQEGNGRVEIFIQGKKICERWFSIGNTEIPNEEEIVLPLEEFSVSDKGPVNQQAPAAANEQHGELDEELVEELIAGLDKFTGLKSVKQGMRDFVDYLSFVKDRKKSGLKTQDNFSLHSVFLGNPGTGKTSVARLLGKIFKAMGLLEKGHVVEVDRAALVGQYIGETAQKTDKILNDAVGGVLFIDEAYTLSKKGGTGQDFGQEAIDLILKRMEDKGNEFAVIAAGYPDEMNSFLDSNPGMKSRFTHFFNFEDFSPEELTEIFQSMAANEEYEVEPEALEHLKKKFTKLYRERDNSFGNARLVRNVFNDSKMQLGKRYLALPKDERTKKALSAITLSDIEKYFDAEDKANIQIPINEEELDKALTKLNKLIGLDSVKKEINEIVKLARYYKEQNKNLSEEFLSHILFLGNPGTGKTTVARIFSEIYSALGILPKGHLVEIDRQGLVAGYVGQTAEKTKAVIDKSIGGVLFIDEAYALIKQGSESGGDFGKEAVDTLLKRMEDDKGRFIVIAAGYTDEMQNFVESNSGIKSRFSKTLIFEDYSPDNLMKIFTNSLANKDYKVEAEAMIYAKKYFNELYRSRDKSFGNARIVRNLIDEGLRKQLLRAAVIPPDKRTKEELHTLKYEDIKDIVSAPGKNKTIKIEGDEEKLEGLLGELNSLTGIESVKKSVEKLISGLRVSKLREERGLRIINKNLHSVFLGNPGAGKTTVARLLSKIYKEMGLLEKGHLVEADRALLVAGYPGQTAIKTDEVIQKALGGFLFIDEAYTLARGADDYGKEAIETLLKRMEDYQGQFAVIVAGYPAEMKYFIDANPGLESRFANYFMFEDFTPRQMLAITDTLSSKNGYKLDEGAWQMLYEIFTDLYKKRDKNFGNARTVKKIFYEAVGNQEERLNHLNLNDDEDLITITIDDIGNLSISEI
jgi:SpoVK/Ycf46/Vps4 family AAA+-type ATPase